MKKVTIVTEEVRTLVSNLELHFGGETPDLEGELIVINPTAEHFASLNPNFAMAVRLRGLEPDDLVPGVVYYDAGAGRHYTINEEDVKIEEVN